MRYESKLRFNHLLRITHQRQHIFYAARPQGLDGPIKLGRTGNVDRRLGDLAREIGRPLELLAVVPEWSCPERPTLQFFAAHRIWGEWFSPDPSLLAFLGGLARVAERAARIEGALRRILNLSESRPLALLADVEQEMARRARWQRRTGIEL